MKRLVLGVLLLWGCRQPAPAGLELTGAPDPRAAITRFLGAVSAQDLQAMSTVWGTSKGPARDQIERSELEKRELTMQCYLTHDRSRILNEEPGEGGRRIYLVELTQGELTRRTRFTTVRGPSERWYVENADIQATRDFCRKR